ncbi:hypothetical protein E1B28_002206 [Marasmius oreades]|uniref:Uncharacterized protein n=1 Tax=Marasmius oreades TaxID=181124 RepID=A0A9P7RMJ8_9AGAR|nr:uncharacterized protein E1B28_002206 [Marasmius oreades]KAG7086235.1 hypothetical protein E1B28_002206 [Marasmius oreades]
MDENGQGKVMTVILSHGKFPCELEAWQDLVDFELAGNLDYSGEELVPLFSLGSGITHHGQALETKVFQCVGTRTGILRSDFHKEPSKEYKSACYCGFLQHLPFWTR